MYLDGFRIFLSAKVLAPGPCTSNPPHSVMETVAWEQPWGPSPSRALPRASPALSSLGVHLREVLQERWLGKVRTEQRRGRRRPGDPLGERRGSAPHISFTHSVIIAKCFHMAHGKSQPEPASAGQLRSRNGHEGVVEKGEAQKPVLSRGQDPWLTLALAQVPADDPRAGQRDAHGPTSPPPPLQSRVCPYNPVALTL